MAVRRILTSLATTSTALLLAFSLAPGATADGRGDKAVSRDVAAKTLHQRVMRSQLDPETKELTVFPGHEITTTYGPDGRVRDVQRERVAGQPVTLQGKAASEVSGQARSSAAANYRCTVSSNSLPERAIVFEPQVIQYDASYLDSKYRQHIYWIPKATETSEGIAHWEEHCVTGGVEANHGRRQLQGGIASAAVPLEQPDMNVVVGFDPGSRSQGEVGSSITLSFDLGPVSIGGIVPAHSGGEYKGTEGVVHDWLTAPVMRESPINNTAAWWKGNWATFGTAEWVGDNSSVLYQFTTEEWRQAGGIVMYDSIGILTTCPPWRLPDCPDPE